jgi:hemin uptake protein HemP
MSDFDQNPGEDKKLPPDKPINQPVISTESLFAGFREITIEHAGEIYRLRITRRNKLILQK